jgi:hypothetical protein
LIRSQVRCTHTHSSGGPAALDRVNVTPDPPPTHAAACPKPFFSVFVQARADDRPRAAAVRPACRSTAAATATTVTPQAGTGTTRNTKLGCQLSPRCRPLRAGRLLPLVELVEGMVRLRRGFSSSPAASQCPCTPAHQEATRTGRHRIDLVNHLRLWPWTRPVGQRRHRLGPLRTRAIGSTHLSMFGGSPHSTIQPHPCCQPQLLCAVVAGCRSVLTLWLLFPRSVRDALVQRQHGSTSPATVFSRLPPARQCRWVLKSLPGGLVEKRLEGLVRSNPPGLPAIEHTTKASQQAVPTIFAILPSTVSAGVLGVFWISASSAGIGTITVPTAAPGPASGSEICNKVKFRD